MNLEPEGSPNVNYISGVSVRLRSPVRRHMIGKRSYRTTVSGGQVHEQVHMDIPETINRSPSRSAVSSSSPSCGVSSPTSVTPASALRHLLHSKAVRCHRFQTGAGISSLLKTVSRFDLLRSERTVLSLPQMRSIRRIHDLARSLSLNSSGWKLLSDSRERIRSLWSPGRNLQG